MIQYFKTPEHRRKMSVVMWIMGAAAILLLLLFFVLFLGIRAMADDIEGTDAAERWQAQDSPHPFSQLAVYMDSSSAIRLDDIYLRRMNITKKLEENAIVPPEGASAFIDAFSGDTALAVTTERATIQTSATVCGGDFFYFHPLELLHGNYFAEDDLTSHSIILDEYAAWQLFGAIDVSGLDVTIGGQHFRIAGVCKKPTDSLESITWGDTPRVFVNYIGLRMTNNFDRASVYEIVLPDPVDNFAANLIKEQFRISEKSADAVMVDITSRFDFEILAKQAPEFFLRAIRNNRILPPFWENAAAVIESKAIVIAAVGGVVGIAGLLCAVGCVSLWFVIHPIRLINIYHFFNDRYEARRMKKWLKKQASPLNTPEKTHS